MEGYISERMGYLTSLIGLRFYGEVILKQVKPTPLGYYMKCLHQCVRQGRGRKKTAITLVLRIMQLRKDESPDKNFEKNFMEDYACFLELWRNRDSLIRSEMAKESSQSNLLRCCRQPTIKPVALLKDDDYWGSRQQLRSGKVIADCLGGLDPVFGALLNPTGGRVGKGNGDLLHTLLYTKEDALAYHSAAHDACGYLFSYHGIGPGYNYIDSNWTIFDNSNPLCCQIPGYLFYFTLEKYFLVVKSQDMHCFLTKEQRESYLREVYYSSFSDRRPSISTRHDDIKNIGKLMQRLYTLVETGEGLSSEAEKTLKSIVKIRMHGKPDFYEAKLFTDYKRFLMVRNQREENMRKSREQQCFQLFLELENNVSPPSLPRGDDWFWGSRQQLRCGEIIGDTLGGMDAVFGCLLCPKGGKLDFKQVKRTRRFLPVDRKKDDTEQEIIMYHTAVHDACGYLLEYHGVGPGYNYLGTPFTVFPTFVPQSGRLAALMFWKKLMNEPKLPDEY